MLKNVENLGCVTAAKILNVSKDTVVRWRKELKLLGEKGLEPGNCIQSQGLKRKGLPKL